MGNFTFRLLLRRPTCLIVTLGLVGLCFAESAVSHSRPANPLIRLNLESLAFEANRGQYGSEIEFAARGEHFTLGLDRRGMTVWMRDREGARSRRLVRIAFEHGGSSSAGVGLEGLQTRSHYLKGRDPESWVTGVPHYRRVRFDGIYSGIDLVYYLENGQLEFDFILAPGADPRQIRLRFDTDRAFRLESNGEVVLRAGGFDFRLHKPHAYQIIQGKRAATPVEYNLRGNELALRVTGPVPGHSLVIDPVISCTYLGGSGFDEALALAVDKQGNAYVGGTTDSRNLPVKSGFQSAYGGDWGDGFVAKLSPDGTQFLYVTYLGGSQTDYVSALAVDSEGAVYVAGVTESSNFPAPNALQSSIGGGMDAFLAKLTPSGAGLLFSTFVGGTGGDMARGLALDVSGNAYLAGHTSSSNFPTANAFQTVFGGGGNDAFLVKIKSDGSSRLYSTYLGGSGAEEAHAVVVNGAGEAHLAGTTSSPDFPLRNAAQPSLGSPDLGDAFVTAFDAAGSGLVFSTYLGGSGFDIARAIGLGADGQILMTGSTDSANFPSTVGPSYGGNTDAFVALFTAQGARTASRFLGGAANDAGVGAQVDSAGILWLAGTTASSDFPVTGAEDKFKGGTGDAFVATLTSPALQIGYAQYFGGTQRETCRALAIGSPGQCLLAGSTSSTGLASVGAAQSGNAGQQDAFVTWISTGASKPPGDANNDGVVSVEDIIGVVRTILLLYSPLGNADVNQDGMVTVEDVVHVTKKILQK